MFQHIAERVFDAISAAGPHFDCAVVEAGGQPGNLAVGGRRSDSSYGVKFGGLVDIEMSWTIEGLGLQARGAHKALRPHF